MFIRRMLSMSYRIISLSISTIIGAMLLIISLLVEEKGVHAATGFAGWAAMYLAISMWIGTVMTAATGRDDILSRVNYVIYGQAALLVPAVWLTAAMITQNKHVAVNIGDLIATLLDSFWPALFATNIGTFIVNLAIRNRLERETANRRIYGRKDG